MKVMLDEELKIVNLIILTLLHTNHISRLIRDTIALLLNQSLKNIIDCEETIMLTRIKLK